MVMMIVFGEGEDEKSYDDNDGKAFTCLQGFDDDDDDDSLYDDGHNEYDADKNAFTCPQSFAHTSLVTMSAAVPKVVQCD